MSTAPKARALPDKESKLFKELLTQYELKQYKKGLKAADTILKKFPNHGETLALKALTLWSSLPSPLTIAAVPKQAEAEELARVAIKKDITSHITWHVLGILAKGKKDWAEASRAFAMARKQDADNIPLIRDSISLYAHTRQYPLAVSTRHHYLTLRPQIRSSWLGLMVAHHLNGDIEEALAVYDALQTTLKSDGGTGPEKSQVMMYVIKICMEAGKYEDGLRRLEAAVQEGIISSRGESTQLKAEMLVKLGRLSEAEDTYRSLLEQNADNLEYYRGFLRTKGYDITTGELDDETRQKVLNALNAFAESTPRSTAPRRLALEIAQGDAFRQAVRTYLISGLERGIPSLFVDVKGLYSDSSKMAVVGEIIEELIDTLKADSGLHEDDSIAPPTTLLWAYYFLALHSSHPRHPNPSYSRSLELLAIALEHTPTLPEIYMAKAMVLKRAGDPLGAAEAMEEARLLDGQDRFLNGKAAKYWLRAGDVKKAEELLALFTADSSAAANLTEMQCLWFMQEEGDAYARNGDLAMALKRYHGLATTFQDYEDDQYDFHAYCMRRMTLNAYVELMRYEDQLRSHMGYFNGALAAIRIYMQLHDDPSLKEEKLSAEEEAEKKKAAKKAQKAEQKAKKAAAATSDGKKEDPPIPDEDPQGRKLLETVTPLDDALKLWLPLQRLASTRIETSLAGYEIYIRKDMYLAALRCLVSSHDIEPSNPELHRQILNFHRRTSGAALPESVKSVIVATSPSLLPSTSTPADFNTSYLSSHSTSPAHIISAAKGVSEIDPAAPVSDISPILTSLTNDGVPPSLWAFQEALSLLKKAQVTGEEVETFRAKCRARMPLAESLTSAEEKAAKQAQGVAQVNGNGAAIKADV